MAIMINCGMDWTYDLFVEDASKYTATPIKGVHCRRNADERERFMRNLKNLVRDYTEKWYKTHENVHDWCDGYIGDGFARVLRDWDFSDYYKDTYGQRPHLDSWFYVTVLGLPTNQDIGRTFCANPVGDAIENAKRLRLAH